MSSGDIAIIVASVSALFTGANMTVSLATYRRGRPRVSMDARWYPHMQPIGDYDADEGLFIVHLVNKSQTAVKVSRLTLRLEFERPRNPSRKRTGALSNLKIVKGEDEKEISPFGGVEWQAQTETDSSHMVSAISRVRLTAVLSNGTKARSKWLGKPPPNTWIVEETARLQALLDQLPIHPKQLSFEELAEME